MIESTVYTLLAAAAGTASVFPSTIPEDPTLPAVAYSFVGGAVFATLDTRGSQRSRLQVDCFASTYNEAVTLRTAIIRAIAGYRDRECSITALQTLDFFDQDSLEYRATVEFYVFYNL